MISITRVLSKWSYTECSEEGFDSKGCMIRVLPGSTTGVAELLVAFMSLSLSPKPLNSHPASSVHGSLLLNQRDVPEPSIWYGCSFGLKVCGFVP